MITTTAYTTEITRNPAPRIGKDLHLKIKVGEDHATIDCRDSEGTGDHTGRQVWFEPDKACTVKFDNPAVFGCRTRELPADTKTPLAVVLPIGKKSWTYCEVEPGISGTKAATEHESPPRIEVP